MNAEETPRLLQVHAGLRHIGLAYGMNSNRNTSPDLMLNAGFVEADPGGQRSREHAPDNGAAGDSLEATRVSRPSIVVINQHAFIRECLARILGDELDVFEVIGVQTVEDLNPVAKRTPRLVVLIIEDDGRLATNLKRHVAAIGQAVPQTPIMLLSQCDDQALAAEACQYGVNGYVTMSYPLDVIVAVLRLVLVGGGYFPNDFPAHRDMRAQWSELSPTLEGAEIEPDARMEQYSRQTGLARPVNFTPRECEVVERLAHGLSNKVIGGELGISKNTVKVHVRHIMRKLGVTNRTAAALFSQQYTSQMSDTAPGASTAFHT